jgi:hypothetical protein
LGFDFGAVHPIDEVRFGFFWGEDVPTISGALQELRDRILVDRDPSPGVAECL